MALSIVIAGSALISNAVNNDNADSNSALYSYWWPYVSSKKTTQSSTQKSTQTTTQKTNTTSKSGASLESVMTYTGKAYAEVYNNKPQFTSSEITTKGYESYSKLDSLGRCGVSMACVGKETMPTKSRTSISSVKPTGWVQKTYDTKLVNGGSLYNRCHLIGFQLTGENANKKNLITGTRYMNENMIPFENMVADYIKETGNHVMYRVTPIFEGKNLVASGVHMEAYSVEDNGEGISFNVYLYNVQPGIVIDYKTGNSSLETAKTTTTTNTNTNNTTSNKTNSNSNTSGKNTTANQTQYILNTKGKKIHKTTCKSASSIREANKQTYTGSLDSLVKQGYTACGNCKPLG
ncbi:MAG: DNA/RNA non-specific endonuclease [Clostridia bacterium]|nr:DNA/RNA non-specific endonuclease [Clostridia bacterium]